MTYEFLVEPFAMGTDKECAAKPLEEAAEAFGEWQLMEKEREKRKQGERNGLELIIHRNGVIYECCDTIQAACNLMARVGATSDDVSEFMEDVHRNNERRGRYVQAKEG